MFRQFYQFQQAGGIAIQLQPDGGATISACLLQLKQQRVEIAWQATAVTAPDALRGRLPAKTTVALNLAGKGVLIKQLPHMDAVTAANFSQVLPNAAIGDFYVQQVISGGISFIAVVRRAEADQWFARLRELGYEPVSLSLGPFPVRNVLADLNFYGERIVFNGHQITRDAAGDWLACQYTAGAKAEFKIKMQTEVIAEDLLLPYAAAFQLLLQDRLPVVAAAAAPYDRLLGEQLAARKFRARALMIGGVFFVLLLANFGVWSWLQSDNEQRSRRLSRTLQNASEIKVNAAQVDEKALILQGLGWDGQPNKAAWVDQLAADLPGGITLTGIGINPPDAVASQQAKSLVFAGRRIRISGVSPQILAVNEWVARIRQKPWVKSAVLENYVFNSEGNTGVFSLTITY